MFGRFFLITLSIISLGWIVFIGVDLLDKKDRISPQHIFTVSDGEILIVNRTNEVQAEKLNFDLQKDISTIFNQLLTHVFPNERLYTSQKRPIIIIELNRIWNENLVQKYLKTKGLKFVQTGKNNYEISNGVQLRFKKNHLLITTIQHLEAHPELTWPLWDSKASASIIHLIKPLKSTNIYFNSNGTVYYQTKYGPNLTCSKIDDADIFAQFLPSKIENYHFFEKEFALKNKIIDAKSPLFQWLDEGFVCFEYEKTKCILSDYNKSVDPAQMLLSNSDESEQLLTNHFKSISLTNNFPSFQDQGFYIGQLGDKVILSENENVMERIIADYQLGNTLALDASKMANIYGKMPKKVSERCSGNKNFFTLSSYKNLLIRTEMYSSIETNLSKNHQNSTQEIDNSSFSVSQETAYIFGNGNIIFAVGNQNEIIALSSKKQLWKLSLDGEIIGKIKLVDLYENGKQQILVSTNRKVYLLSSTDGSKINEFPLDVLAQNSISMYRWNGKSSFLIVNNNNELLQIDENGRIIKKLKLQISNIIDEVNVYKNGKTLTAIVTGENKVQTIDLERNKIIKSNIFLPKNHIALKNESAYNYFTIENNTLISYDLQGKKKAILQSKEKIKVKKIFKGKEQFLGAQSGKFIYLFNNSGIQIEKIQIDLSDMEDFDILTMTNGQEIIAVLDGIENNIHIFDSKGIELIDKSFEGKNIVKLSDANGKLIITSSLNRNIIQHYDILNTK